MNDLKIVNYALYDNGWSPWGGGIAIDYNPDIQNVVNGFSLATKFAGDRQGFVP
jgi:hypothetical protein